ncbi:MAG: GDP-mannose 4,6-dehydratase [Bacteroidota bacterium]|nr:GDP-mannose 4,6-dehydratase [Bacteroidota bacterium]
MNKRILITGVAGFIGSSLADNLIRNNCIVFGIDNFDPFYERSVKEKNIADVSKQPGFSFQEGDIRDSHFIERCILEFRPDVIVHLAAKAGVRPSIKDPATYYDVNVAGTLTILEVMKKNSIKKMIFASSSSVYGNNEKVPFSEKDNVDYPISPYAATKKAGELLCHTFHHLYEMDIFCLRFFTVYGPRQRPDLAIYKFTRAIMKEEPLTLYGDGTSSRDYTYIDDIVHGIKLAISRVRGFEVINLGDSEPVSLGELVRLLEKITCRKAVRHYLPAQEGDVFRTYADIRKAGKMLNYKPATNIESGIARFVEWFRENN